MKITPSQIVKVRVSILARQGHKCPLCEAPLRAGSTNKKPALDHDHATGFIRGVLCINCNGAEGRIMKRAKSGSGVGNDPILWLQRLVDYLTLHRTPQWGVPGRPGLIHPSHKTETEKRIKRLASARKSRAKRKAIKGE